MTFFLFLYKFNQAAKQVKKYLEQGETARGISFVSSPVMIKSNAKYDLAGLRKLLVASNFNENRGLNVPKTFFEDDEYLWVRLEKFNVTADQVQADEIVRFHKDGGIYPEQDPSPLKRAIYLPPTPLGETQTTSRKSQIALAELPKHLIDALIAVEDRRFYSHWGIDPYGLLRAVTTNLTKGSLIQGGSTLTQQLVKNVLLSPKRTLSRKFNELFLAFALEYYLDKDTILERYLNEIYFAQDGGIAVHGIEAASMFLFGHSAKTLTLKESAMLVGMVKAPTTYSPIRNLKKANKRATTALGLMLENEAITKEEYEKALNENVKIQSESPSNSLRHYKATLVKLIDQKTSLDLTGNVRLTVNTSIYPHYQECAEQAVKLGITELKKQNRKYSNLEQSLVAIDSRTGLVRAYVGGADFANSQFDHVSDIKRQLGSVVKPFLYLSAIDRDLNEYKQATAISILEDKPITIPLTNGSWKPENYNKNYFGKVTLRFALEKSLNVPAVFVASKIGLNSLMNTYRKVNLASEINLVPSIALGAIESNLLAITGAYTTFFNGTYVAPRLLTEVTNSEREVVLKEELVRTYIAGAGPTYIITNILQGVVERGTAKNVRQLGYQGAAAGKTGTAQNGSDAWFIGYTPNMVTGVWTGSDQLSPLGLTGGSASVPTWTYFNRCVKDYVPKEQFLQPANVKLVNLDLRCSKSYNPKLATAGTPKQYLVAELFIEGSEPTEYCNVDFEPLAVTR